MAFLPIVSRYLSSEYQASLANGAEIDSGWLDMQAVDKYQIEALASAVGMDVVISSSTASGGGEADVSSTTTTDTVFFLTSLTARQRYMRFQFQNNTGGALTDVALSVKAFYGSSDKLSVFPLSVAPSNFSQAALVRAVSTGQQPDGDYVNNKQDGVAVTTESTLSADATYTSSWVDSDGWNTLEVFVQSDVASAQQGILVEFTDDASGTPTVRGSRKFTFSPADVENGFKDIRLPVLLDGFRVSYTNGGEDQGSFYLSATLRTQPENRLFNVANAQVVADFGRETAFNVVDNYSSLTIFGRNDDITTSSDPEDIWSSSGDYTGFDATGDENLSVVSTSTSDVGTEVSSGTATGGSDTTLIDSTATFSTDGVANGDIVINDSQGLHGVVTSVDSETQLTVFRMTDGERGEYPNKSGDSYRVATTGSTGAAVVKVETVLDSSLGEQTSQYFIMNGTTVVTNTVNCMRANKARVILAGSGGEAAGEISGYQATSTSNVFFVIPQGFDASLEATGTVPFGEIWLIVGLRASISRANGAAGSATLSLRRRPCGETFASVRAYEVTVGSSVNVNLSTGILLSSGTDFKWRCDEVGSNNTSAEASVEIVKLLMQ